MSFYIPTEVKQKCLQHKQNGATVREIYDNYYSELYPSTKYEAFRRNISRWQRKSLENKEYIENANLDYKFPAHATTVQLNNQGEIVQSWIKGRREDDQMEELLQAIKAQKPIEVVKATDIQAKRMMLEIPFFDLHFPINDLEYYKETLADTIALIESEAWEQIFIPIGQDLFHNDDFRGRTSSGTPIEAVDMVKAWNDARQFYYNIINSALLNAKSVEIMFTPGNHDESMGWAFVQMIKAEYADNIKVCDTLDDYKLKTFYKCFIGITHGEKVKGNAERLRGIYTSFYPMEFAKCTVRSLHVGHLHHYSGKDLYGLEIEQLSTKAHCDEWHIKHGFVGTHKRFKLFIWGEDKLIGTRYV